MENSYQNLDEDMLITSSRVDEVESNIDYLQDINSLILELRRIREELNNVQNGGNI